MQSPDLVQANDEAPLDEESRLFLLRTFIKEDEALMDLLAGLRALALPDWRLVSGAIYQTIWNRLTGNPSGYGIKDYDVAYFDASDLSYEAEDRVIIRAEAALPKWAGRIEVRNQARVHLWYLERFGGPYPQLRSTDESLENYMCTTHAVAVRLEADDCLSVAAPFGLEDIFSLTIRPCKALATNRTNYAQKARRMARLWPELRILDWETGEPVCPDQLS